MNHAPLPSNTTEPIYNHLLAPRTFHWNLNVQQELPGAFTAQVSYVGERGEHLFGTTEFNPYVNNFFSGDRLINSRGRIVVRDNSGDSNYNGMWAELDRKMAKGFLFRAAYTYARSMDDVSEVFTTNNESTYGSASYPCRSQERGHGALRVRSPPAPGAFLHLGPAHLAYRGRDEGPGQYRQSVAAWLALPSSRAARR